MIKEFLESLKLKDLVFFVLIIVLFCMYFKKNKKEGFAGQISNDNLQAIKNLGDFAAGLKSGGTSGEYEFPGTTLNLIADNSKIKVKSIEANSIKIGTVTIDQSYLDSLVKKEAFPKINEGKIIRMGGDVINNYTDARERCITNNRKLASVRDLKVYEINSPQGYGAWTSENRQYNGYNANAPYAENTNRYTAGTTMDNENKKHVWCKLPWL